MYLNHLTYDGSLLDKVRLTLTWDVFKFVAIKEKISCINRLTLTWDVFKSYI